MPSSDPPTKIAFVLFLAAASVLGGAAILAWGISFLAGYRFWHAFFAMLAAYVMVLVTYACLTNWRSTNST